MRFTCDCDPTRGASCDVCDGTLAERYNHPRASDVGATLPPCMLPADVEAVAS